MPTQATSSRYVAWLSVALLIGAASAAPPTRPIGDSSRIIVTLYASGRVASPILRVADVAELRGGDSALRQQIAELDLDDASTSGGLTEMTPRQIEFRLRVAGIDPQSFTVRGSTTRAMTQATESPASTPLAAISRVRSSVVAKPDTSAIEQLVLDAARKCLSKQLPWSEENIVIDLAQPLPRELIERTLSEDFTCSADLRAAGTPLGRVAMKVVLKAPGQRSLEVPVQLDVRHFEDVVVTTKPVARGHVFSPDDLELGRQDVTQVSGYCTSREQFVGQKSKRIIPAAQLVRAVDLETANRTAEPLLIKRRDRVKATAHSGTLQVTIVGEAMQDGRAGEVIKVKNVVSNVLIYGRVLSATEIEVTE